MSAPNRPTHTTDRWDWTIAAALFCGTVALLMATTQMGIPRDESFYFHAAGRYIEWFRELAQHWEAGELWQSFTKANIDKHWSYNSEHPVLMKTAFALSNELFHHTLGWTDASTALRLPGAMTGAGCIAVVYLFCAPIFGRVAGLVSAAALLGQPRFFFHAHLACFDVPITFFWLATIYAYWRSLNHQRWAPATGLLWGLALCTKLNAFFIPVVIFAHWLTSQWRHFGFDSQSGRVQLPDIPTAFYWLTGLGPLVFYALTPRFWFDTTARVGQYLSFHLNHVHYPVQYFHQNIQFPPLPISYPWVMTLVTVPATILLAALLGVGAFADKFSTFQRLRAWGASLPNLECPPALDHRHRATFWLVGLNALFPIALISAPDTPIFGGTKHWMPAMPFIAIFAGAGTVWAAVELARLLAERFSVSLVASRRTLVTLVTLLTLAPAATATAHNHPFGTSYYNTLVGGVRGAADAGMFRQFWGYTSRQALPWLNEHAPKQSSLWLHNTTGFAWWFYKNEGVARNDLRSVPRRRSDFALFHQQRAFVHQQAKLWKDYRTFTPAYVVEHDGVPLLSTYRRPSGESAQQPSTAPDSNRTIWQLAY
jgi:hypothetical protein